MRQKLQAKMSVSRVTCSRGECYVSIRVQDSTSGVEIAEFEIDFETFGKLVTGASFLPVKAEVGNFDVIGCTQETKTVQVVYDHVCPKADEKARKDAACAPFETDGWRLYRPDLGNFHKRAKAADTWNVTAWRFVRPDGSPVL
jgi:hypothetical protein